MMELSSEDIEQIRRAFERMPGKIKTMVMSRAMRGITREARSRIVSEAAAHSNMPRPVVNALTTAAFNAGGNTQAVVLESNWIHLYKLGAVQNADGTFVVQRGQYKHAFITGFKTGHAGVMRRIAGTQMPSAPMRKDGNGQVKRQQMRELFGANPANVVTNDPDRYLEVLAEIIRDKLYPNFQREILRALTF